MRLGRLESALGGLSLGPVAGDDTYERFSNAATTTLAEAMDASDTVMVVSSAALFPAVGYFRVKVENEIMLVTGIVGKTLYVTRGSESTTAASHAAATEVQHIVTKGALEALPAKFHLQSAYASRPPAGVTGRIHLPTDGPLFSRDNGTIWQPHGLLFPLTTPVDGDFSWLNQGTASVVADKGVIHLNAPAGTSNIRARIMSAPTPPYTVTALVHLYLQIVNYNQAGLCFRESSSGKLQTFLVVVQETDDVYIRTDKLPDNTGFTGTYGGPKWSQRGPLWMRMKDDGTNRICQYSLDGVNFITLHSVSRTDYLTANQIGFFANSNNATWGCGITLYSWKVE